MREHRTSDEQRVQARRCVLRVSLMRAARGVKQEAHTVCNTRYPCTDLVGGVVRSSAGRPTGGTAVGYSATRRNGGVRQLLRAIPCTALSPVGARRPQVAFPGASTAVEIDSSQGRRVSKHESFPSADVQMLTYVYQEVVALLPGIKKRKGSSSKHGAEQVRPKKKTASLYICNCTPLLIHHTESRLF